MITVQAELIPLIVWCIVLLCWLATKGDDYEFITAPIFGFISLIASLIYIIMGIIWLFNNVKIV